MAKFEIKNVVATEIAEVEAPQIVTISPTLFYNNPASHAAAYEDAMTGLNGIVRIPVYGGRQYVELKPGEIFTVECENEAEIAFYTNLCDRLDGKFVKVITKEGANPAPAATEEDGEAEDNGAEG